MPTNASPTWPHLSLIRTVIANRVETAFADNQDLHEPGVFFSRDRVLNFPGSGSRPAQSLDFDLQILVFRISTVLV
jgi:hypothetical protein